MGTRARRQLSPRDQEAMNATTERVKAMCREDMAAGRTGQWGPNGNETLACVNAKKDASFTREMSEAMARERERQAVAERAHIARKLDQVGQHQVATAVRKEHDVHYRADDTIARTAPSRPSPPTSSFNAGDVLTGIGTILAPLAQAGVGIYSATQQAKLAKIQYKFGRQPSSSSSAMYLPPASDSNDTIIIAAVAGGGLLIMMMMFMMMR